MVRQGDQGEYAAIAWLGSHGYHVYVPLGHSADIDVVAGDPAGRLLGVQVKTSTVLRHVRYEVTLATRGGNQSWSGVSKLFSPKRCDYLFVLVGDGRQWFIPAGAVGGGSGILLGGPKYSVYEVDPGPRLARSTLVPALS